MKFDKIVYIRYIPLTVKIYEDFYIRQVEDMGIVVEYWDISRLFFKNLLEQEDSSHLCVTFCFQTYSELEGKIALTNIARTLFIPIMTLEGGQRKLYQLFTKYNCRVGIFGRNMFPQPSSINTPIIKRLLNITPKKVLNFINDRRLKKEMGQGKVKCFEVIFLGGKWGWQGIGHIEQKQVLKAENVKINSDDYDNYLKLRNQKNRLIEEEYILFLDEYLPLHPDIKLLGMKAITPEEYYPQLNAYFDRVEKQFGMPVVIAAHPKALRYKEEDFFGGRKVYFGKSALLSKDAYFVIAHATTSINYPIAFGKKLHFITSENIVTGIRSVHLNVLCIAKYLRCHVQYFDHSDEPITLVDRLDEERYKIYKYDFQTSPETENILSEDIFMDYLRN